MTSNEWLWQERSFQFYSATKVRNFECRKESERRKEKKEQIIMVAGGGAFVHSKACTARLCDMLLSGRTGY